jgi:folate-binding protein YgfZ
MMAAGGRLEATMTGRWRDFLEDAGAVMDDSGRVLHFGNPGRELQVVTRGDILVDLSHFGLIQASGPEAARFLQGQLTNDVLEVGERHSQLGGYCTPKGRLLAVPRIFLREQSFYLQLPATLLAPTLERLRKYVLMAKVTLADGGEALTGVGLAGPGCERALGELIEPLPAATDEVTQAGGMTAIRLPGTQPRFALYGPVELMEKTWDRLAAHAAPAGADAWTLLDVLAGVPAVYPETVDAFVPQQVNLDKVGGISFKKGCYTGQEIVARVHYRGAVKRRMYLARCEAAPPRPGETVLSDGGEERTAGQVVAAAPAPEGGCRMLVSLVTERAGAGLHLGQPEGPRLELLDLPYLRAGAD